VRRGRGKTLGIGRAPTPFEENVAGPGQGAEGGGGEERAAGRNPLYDGGREGAETPRKKENTSECPTKGVQRADLPEASARHPSGRKTPSLDASVLLWNLDARQAKSRSQWSSSRARCTAAPGFRDRQPMAAGCCG